MRIIKAEITPPVLEPVVVATIEEAKVEPAAEGPAQPVETKQETAIVPPQIEEKPIEKTPETAFKPTQKPALTTKKQVQKPLKPIEKPVIYAQPTPKYTPPAVEKKQIIEPSVLVFPPPVVEKPRIEVVPELEIIEPKVQQPEEKDESGISRVMLASLMSWVERETGVKTPAMPNVVVSHERLSQILKRMGAIAGRAQSAYISGTVIMDDLRWDPEDSTQISLLVHELVHHAQLFMKNANWPCPDAREAQAYTLQNRWLEQNGHYAFVQASWISRISSCSNRSSEVYLAQRYSLRHIK